MEEEAHVANDEMVNVCEQLVGRMVAELAGAEGVEAANATKQSALLGQFLIDEGGDGTEGDEPGPLNIVHLLGINISMNHHNPASNNRSFEVNAEHDGRAVHVLVGECKTGPVVELGVPQRFGGHTKALSFQLPQDHLHAQLVPRHLQLWITPYIHFTRLRITRANYSVSSALFAAS